MDFSKYNELNKKGLADFHAHTCFCDGDCTAEEMVRAAAEKGLAAFGLSGHGYTAYDESYCMSLEDEAVYEEEVRALAADCAGQMEVLCGVEQDCLAGTPTREWDYVIGSVHYIDCGGRGGIIPIDESREI